MLHPRSFSLFTLPEGRRSRRVHSHHAEYQRVLENKTYIYKTFFIPYTVDSMYLSALHSRCGIGPSLSRDSGPSSSASSQKHLNYREDKDRQVYVCRHFNRPVFQNCLFLVCVPNILMVYCFFLWPARDRSMSCGGKKCDWRRAAHHSTSRGTQVYFYIYTRSLDVSINNNLYNPVTTT